MVQRPLFFLFGLSLLFSSCDMALDEANVVDGNQVYVPVYAQLTEVEDIKLESARPFARAGKMYIYGDYLFQNDLNQGVHIIDVRNPAEPRKLAFLKVPFSTEVAVKGRFLYTNNYEDMLTFDLAKPETPILVDRIPNVFKFTNQEYPQYNNILFVCPDPAKGVVVDWELKSNIKADCRR